MFEELCLVWCMVYVHVSMFSPPSCVVVRTKHWDHLRRVHSLGGEQMFHGTHYTPSHRFKDNTILCFLRNGRADRISKEFWTGAPSLKYQIRILKVVDKSLVWCWSHHTAHYIEFKTMSPSINAVSKRKTQRNSHLNLPCCWSCFVFGSHFVSTPPPTPQVLPLTWSSKLFFGTKLTDQMFSKAVMTGQNRKLQMLMNGGRPHYISSRYCGSKNHFFSERMFSFFCGVLGVAGKREDN